ncbi:SDR family NAD(P)-dependent oxidoreductase [Shimia biformata]|uniref:SDR family NAD(P)-dependent oxidoreductase n=1 Tax=Shimia biformata TaxID=1294299 RepID=UPI00194EF3F5|nr:SDR family NAD(P)-dependent oxidoreductase [Shimia biformata]
MFKGQTIWIVGASEGLGEALARALDQQGARLILSARNRRKLDLLAAELNRAVSLPMDITDAASVAKAWETDALDMAAEIDHIVYCAGAYAPMASSDWDTGAALSMVDVNFSGALRVLGHVVPAFLTRDRGEITLIGSLAGFRGLPGAIGYSASKGALMHLGENLAVDLRHTGVRTRIVNPGFIDTRLTRKNNFRMPMLMDPDTAARHVVTAMTSRRFATSFPRPFSWLFRVAPLLPNWVYLLLFGARA